MSFSTLLRKLAPVPGLLLGAALLVVPPQADGQRRDFHDRGRVLVSDPFAQRNGDSLERTWAVREGIFRIRDGTARGRGDMNLATVRGVSLDDAALAGWMGGAGCAPLPPVAVSGAIPVRIWPATCPSSCKARSALRSCKCRG